MALISAANSTTTATPTRDAPRTWNTLCRTCGSATRDSLFAVNIKLLNKSPLPRATVFHYVDTTIPGPYLTSLFSTYIAAVSHGEWGDANSCAARLCQCDLKLSMCLRKYYCPLKRNVCTASPWRLLQNFIKDF